MSCTEVLATTKTCGKCGVEKSLDEFYVDRGRQRHRPSCKRCDVANSTAWQAANPERVRKWRAENPERLKVVQRRSRLKAYGLTPKAWDEMHANQGGLCAICGTDEPATRTGKLDTEHSHATGTLRGLACGHCNKGIGLFFDDPHLLEVAAEYLRSATEYQR